MRVLLASSEIYPYSKTGGLVDFCHSLIKSLREKEGIDAMGATPLYKSVDIEKFKIKNTGLSVSVILDSREYTFEIFKSKDTYFFYNEKLFGREHIYGPAGQSYHDNDIRFGGFSWAVAKAVAEGLISADVIHANDWQTALIPVILKEVFKSSVKTVFTIHNLAYQGYFDRWMIDRLHLPPHLYNMEALEFWGMVNLLKGGIIFSDFVTTVSEKYAKEILTQDYGWGLEGVLNKYSFKLRGILNGIDYDTWNPKKDKAIWVNYSHADIQKKFENKKKLCEVFNLDFEKPLISFISRLSYQKGVTLILESIRELSYLGANFFFLGSGEYAEHFRGISGIYDNIVSITDFDDTLSRRLFASSDFMLMPSIFEPCGITQMIGMRYGCVPIVRKVGGLEETVKDISEEGWGIVFDNPSKGEMLCAIKRAIDLFYNRKKFLSAVKDCMRLDFSSDSMAKKYLQIYRELTGL